MKYLSEIQAKTNLSLGKAIEQWLNIEKFEEYDIIKWLRIDKEKDKTYSVTYFEVFDEGEEDFLDIYSFSPLNPDLPYGNITSFPNIEEAISFSKQNYFANDERFVNAGIIQNEYESNVWGTK